MKLTVDCDDGLAVTAAEIHDAAVFMLSILMSEDMDRYAQISLEICVCNDMLSHYHRAAESNWTDNAIRPDEFYIDIDATLERKPFLILLAHELVHIKQMAFGQRQESLDKKAMRWMGMLINPDELNYYDLPWEIEANGREYGLYKRYKDHLAGKPAAPFGPGDDDSIRIRFVA